MQPLSCSSLAVKRSKLCFMLFLAIGLGLGGVTAADAQTISVDKSSARPRASISPLVDKVRVATARYLDINVALQEGWVRGTPCVSGPNSGAMGVHFILSDRVGDGVLDANAPEALIYEPLPSGALRLVGVEFIVLASDWARLHPDGSTPALDGHLTNYVGEPNRYGLPAFYELHVWAWEQNPNGSFADWNTQVSCDNQLPG
jgi:hypothetical protein